MTSSYDSHDINMTSSHKVTSYDDIISYFEIINNYHHLLLNKKNMLHLINT